jgi:hypothetical protein
MGTLVLTGATSGSATLTPVDAVTATITLPSATATLATLGAQTFVGNQAITGALSVSTTLTVTGVSTLNAAVGFNAAAGANIISHSSGYGLQITAASAVNQLRLTRTGSATADFRNYVSGDTWNVADLSGTGGLISLQSNGLLLILSAYNFTTGSAANVFVQSDGSMVRSTSSLKYKENLRYADDGALDSVKSAMLQLRGFRYQSVDKQFDGDRDFIGWGAEHLDALGLKELVQYDKDGSPTGVMYDRAVVPLTMIVKELSAKIEALEARLAALEAK